MKKISLILVVALILTMLCACGEPQGKKEVTAADVYTEKVDIAIGDAVIGHFKETATKGECRGEGHVILGSETSEGKSTYYVIASYGEYAPQEDAMCRIWSSGFVPVVIVLDENYNLVELKAVEMYNIDSLIELVPEEYHERIILQEDEDFRKITAAEGEYIGKYLEKNNMKMVIKM